MHSSIDLTLKKDVPNNTYKTTQKKMDINRSHWTLYLFFPNYFFSLKLTDFFLVLTLKRTADQITSIFINTYVCSNSFSKLFLHVIKKFF